MALKNKPVSRAVTKRSASRIFGGENAREALGLAEFGKGREAFFLSAGQFSSVDWIDAILDYTGPADAVIATWTAAAADMRRVKEWVLGSRIRRCSWLVDRSFPNRQPELCGLLRDEFGDDAIRVFATHAKFALIHNDDWQVVALTSANLNANRRVEFFHAADDAGLFAEFSEMVATVFDAQKPSEGWTVDAEKAAPFKALLAAGTEARMKREASLDLDGPGLDFDLDADL